MKNIKFISSWNNFTQTTWSGTPYGIFKALSKKVNVELIKATPPPQEKIVLLKKSTTQ